MITVDDKTVSTISRKNSKHNNIGLLIDAETYLVISNDNRIYLDDEITINNGIINIIKSDEGVESNQMISINRDVGIRLSDDVIHDVFKMDSFTSPLLVFL